MLQRRAAGKQMVLDTLCFPQPAERQLGPVSSHQGPRHEECDHVALVAIEMACEWAVSYWDRVLAS